MSLLLPGESAFQPLAMCLKFWTADMKRAALMMYLTDWKCAIETGSQATCVAWTIRPDGTLEIDNIADEIAPIQDRMRFLEKARLMYDITNDNRIEAFEVGTDMALRHVMKTCMSLNDHDLSLLVRSTYPFFHQGGVRGLIDMKSLAAAYQPVRNELEETRNG